MVVYNAVALAQCLARLDDDVIEREAAAVIKDAPAGAVGVLCCRIGARAARTVVGGLAILNGQVLEDDGDTRPGDMKHAIMEGAGTQPGGIDNGRIRS